MTSVQLLVKEMNQKNETVICKQKKGTKWLKAVYNLVKQL